jgi:hypothetical protein
MIAYFFLKQFGGVVERIEGMRLAPNESWDAQVSFSSGASPQGVREGISEAYYIPSSHL